MAEKDCTFQIIKNKKVKYLPLSHSPANSWF